MGCHRLGDMGKVPCDPGWGGGRSVRVSAPLSLVLRPL